MPGTSRPGPSPTAAPALALAVVLSALPAFAGAGVDDEARVIGQPDTLAVTPATIELVDRRDTRQLLVAGHYADGSVRDLSHLVTIEVDDPQVVTIAPGGHVAPKANGRTTIRLRAGKGAGERNVAVPVTVAGLDRLDSVSFRREVIAALNVSGCNAGACHGTPSGKNGFKLSLRGFDPAADYLQLTRDLAGRRISLSDPDSSLILQKGQGQVPHEGGQRLRPDDPAFPLIQAWIASGAKDDPADLPRLTGIAIAPGPHLIKAPSKHQQISVTARFADGTTRDVTRLTVFTSSDEAVGQVDRNGLVEFHRPGQVAILARYLDELAPVLLTYIDPDSSQPWTNPPTNNYVDTHVFAKQKLLGLAPADLAPDHEFIRRISLDLCGVLPTPEEVRLFLNDSRPDKRARLVDSLLERPEYADIWALKWADVLGNNRRAVQAKGAYAFHGWIRDHVARNTPFDVVVRELLSAKGSTFNNPPASFFRNDRIAKEPQGLAQNTAQLFLGVRMSCAQCHNHPFERWTQDDYYGFSAFFARVTSKLDPTNPRIARFNQGALIIEDDKSGETIHPRTGQVVPPKFLGGAVAEIPPGGERRVVLANWLTSQENPFFARELANRTWYHLLGRGIVDPVDDVRDSNPPASEELLEALAQDLIANRYDVKQLIRTIVNSRVYQLASLPDEETHGGARYFVSAVVKMVPAEPLLDAISSATGSPELFDDPDQRNRDAGQKLVDVGNASQTFGGMPLGTRAAQLPDGDVYQHPFLSAFGQPARETSCECERGGDAGLVHALQLINGPSVKDKLSRPENRIGRLLAADRPDSEVIEEVYLATLSRLPTSEERAAGVGYVSRSPDRRRAWEDVQWALLNSKEFLFRH
ncbi:DUF1549 domain-containing protein [Singulisphaera acidiphila]|uniref:Ig-like domain-containing protein n=1 Tax=Singulisphaera acidiphila (strain ATCC BAA-1392 / DSM 18658 / VKM B-2454 / MOB10) TaxID=886293 RepID=L0DDS7_SINAD|nr:DUF1549 domain-containing protein [Singulisphaera acidiphila]AGA27020.1 Ig-like domain-containing protein [Singulisphaera acidiphila DSM 18658]